MALDLDDVETTHEQVLQLALIGAAAELERVHEHWTAATERWERERKTLSESLERVKGERDAARAEAETLRNEVDRLRADPSIQAMLLTQVAIGDLTAEVDRLRAERDALKSAASGWTNIGLVWAHPDGRCMVNRGTHSGRGWNAITESARFYSADAIEAARAAGWHDFPGASDHSAGDP